MLDLLPRRRRQLGSGDGGPSPLRFFLLLAIALSAAARAAVADDVVHPDDGSTDRPEAAVVEPDEEDEDPDPLTLYRTGSRSSVYFPRGSAEITGPAMDTIAENAQRLAADAQRRVRLVGFTDDFSGSDEADELAERRAAAVKERLVGLGIPAERIGISVNREDPQVVPCTTELCRLSYRRVRFVFVDARRTTSAASDTGRSNAK